LDKTASEASLPLIYHDQGRKGKKALKKLQVCGNVSKVDDLL
jgi:hypothetical protein